jgi:hypothetical protein
VKNAILKYPRRSRSFRRISRNQYAREISQKLG